MRSHSSQAAAPSESAWFDEWGDRISCWFAQSSASTQEALRGCTATLTERLRARFDATVGVPRGIPAAAERGCAWVGELSLPQFPAVTGAFEFETPPQLLPWGLRKWIELGDDQSRLHGRPGLHSTGGLQPASESSTSLVGADAALLVGIGGAGFSAGALLMWSLRRRPA